MSVPFDFNGKTILVTGASRGIGYAIAKRFAEAGGQLIILADEEFVHEAAEKIRSETNAMISSKVCDVADRSAVSEVFSGISHLDVVINNAGVGWATPLLELGRKAEETFERQMAINFFGSYYITRQAAPLMKEGGSLLFTSSIWGKTAGDQFSGYVASKHAIIGFVRALAIELGPKGISVNAICPGGVETDANKAIPQDLVQKVKAKSHLKRNSLMIDSMELAYTYLFLASEYATDITGQAISVDRGEFIG